MKKSSFVLLAGALCTMLMGACKGGSSDDLKAERDSLAAKCESQAQELSGVNAVLDDLSLMIDSMASAEGLLFLNGSNKQEVMNDRAKIKTNLAAYKQLVARQRTKMKEIEQRLSKSTSKMANLKSVIGMMLDELDDKEYQIDELYAQIEDKNFDIDHLRNHLWRKDRKIEEQQQVMDVQDKIINECFYLVGTKKELKELGILTKGTLFKKGQADLGNIPKERFAAVDIRKFRRLPLQGQSVKLISPAPDGSYELSQTDGGWVLNILDPTQFWSVSNYLVVQCD